MTLKTIALLIILACTIVIQKQAFGACSAANECTEELRGYGALQPNGLTTRELRGYGALQPNNINVQELRGYAVLCCVGLNISELRGYGALTPGSNGPAGNTGGLMMTGAQ